jgi:hypothetical protein
VYMCICVYVYTIWVIHRRYVYILTLTPYPIHLYTHIHTYINTYIHTHIHIRIHIRIHIHTGEKGELQVQASAQDAVS